MYFEIKYYKEYIINDLGFDIYLNFDYWLFGF